MDEKTMIREVLKAYKSKIQKLEEQVEAIIVIIKKQDEDIEYLSNIILEMTKKGVKHE